MEEDLSPSFDFESILHNHIDLYPPESIFVCFLCSFESKSPIELLNHLKDTHNFVFTDLLHIPLLPKYLEYWRIHPPPIVDISNDFKTIDINSEEDIEIRNSLHKMRLDQIMIEHEKERTEYHNQIDCLFCTKTFDGTWHAYLQWLFEEHQFNPGRPSNLIYIPYLINLLRSKIESNACIYCSSTFPNQRTLRSHMRKKKHMRIPNDQYFDRFYMVNYLELNGKWESDNDEDEDEFNGEMEPLEVAAAADNETEIDETVCLICDKVFQSPEHVIYHMRQSHNFDINIVKKAAHHDFYNCVRFINFARFMKSRNICFVCQEDVEGDYVDHIMGHDVKFPSDTSHIFGEDQLLIPFIDGDPLLTELEDDI